MLIEPCPMYVCMYLFIVYLNEPIPFAKVGSLPSLKVQQAQHENISTTSFCRGLSRVG